MIQSFNNSTIQKLIGSKLILPFYHTVSDKPLPHTKHLYQVKTVKEFCNDLDFLLKHYEPIDSGTLIRLSKNEIGLKKPVFHLSFDDGLSQSYNVIAPILLTKGIPATFFVNSAFVDNKALFYRYRASLILDHFTQFNKLTPDFKYKILSVSYREKKKLNEFMSQEEVDSFLKEEKPYLTMEQIRDLSKQGFSIGSHSIDHPFYGNETLEEQLRQTIESLGFVSNNFDQSARLFAFPFTDYNVSSNFFEAIKEYVDLTFGTAGIKQDSILFNLQRIAAESSKPGVSLESIIKKGKRKFYIKRLLQKHVVEHVNK